MDPKEKKVKEEELNVEETHNPAEDQPQNEQAEGTAPLTHEEELEKELEKAQEALEEQKDKYLRLSAEFDNYRKRTLKEKAELILNGGEKESWQYSSGSGRLRTCHQDDGNGNGCQCRKRRGGTDLQ